MDYEKTTLFTGDAKKALEVARNVFIQHSFQIINGSESELKLVSSGTIWIQGQDPLVGISRVNIRGNSGSLSIEAEFGTIRKTIKYLIFFILGLAVSFLVLFGIFLYKPGQPTYIFFRPLAPFAPWPILIPLMAKFLKYRTTRALDVLLNNMVTIGKES